MGRANTRSDVLGLMRNTVLGKNSPVRRITPVDMRVCITRMNASLGYSRWSHGSSSAAAAMP